MKNTFKIVLIILMLTVGLSGCTNGMGVGDDSLSQQELWNRFKEYPRYLSEWGAQDCALVFENDDDLTFDYSVYLGEGYDFYFTELKSFNYEGGGIYKLEYENPYPDTFEKAVFYIDLNSKDSKGFKFGAYHNGVLEYVEVYADIGLTIDELYQALAKYNKWVEVDTDIYGGYFVKACEGDKFDFGKDYTDFWLRGTILNVEYHGYMHYTMTVDYPGYEGDEMTDPYDPYTAGFYMYYNPHFEQLIIELYEEAVEFAPDRELSAEEFFAELSKFTVWYEVDGENYRGFFAKFSDHNKFDLGLLQTDFWLQGTISGVEYHGSSYYTMTVDYEGYEGDEMTDPFDPYTAEYHIYYYPSNEVLMIVLYDTVVEFSPEVEQGLNQ